MRKITGYPKTQPAIRNRFANVQVGLQVMSPVILYPKDPSHQ